MWGVELWGKSWTPAAHHSLQWWHSVSHTASDRWSEHESQWKKKTPLTPSWRWVSAKWLDRRVSQNPHTSFINAVRSGLITQNNFPPTRSAYSKQKHCSSSRGPSLMVPTSALQTCPSRYPCTQGDSVAEYCTYITCGNIDSACCVAREMGVLQNT